MNSEISSEERTIFTSERAISLVLGKNAVGQCFTALKHLLLSVLHLLGGFADLRIKTTQLRLQGIVFFIKGIKLSRSLGTALPGRRKARLRVLHAQHQLPAVP